MVDKERAKQQISELVEKYRKLATARDFGAYGKEENTKKDFIERLFLALGWNVYNSPNFQNSSEVTAEEQISKGRVDYGFRINGIPKFFLEAKALTGNLEDQKFARQAIDYSWLKGCTWAVLTNFETVKIFNAELKTMDLVQSHFMTMHCQEFLDRFEDLWLLSEESFQKSLLDKAAERWGKKSKKSPVGEQLLADFTQWRERLSKDILRRNQSKRLTEVELDEAVQGIIDRLIFIRNCEDRGLEERKLLPTVREWENRPRGMLIERIREVFDGFIRDYDSKLFAESLCDQLDISNEVIQEIVNGLYNTKDKIITYDFSAIDADVLGEVYEQYLSHILKKTEKRAKLTEEVAHRKEQGIYYTPTYIVSYIVRNTLDELLKENKADVKRIRILDPSCGSGSFLIKAFDVLNEFYAKISRGDVQAKAGAEGNLPFATKVEVLKNNVFGVDLDKQAVEITRLNLLLKVAERKRILPTLEENVKCGNSLIDEEAIAGDKAFKWKSEFQHVMDEGGFDVVVGNPPYGAELSQRERDFISKRYPFSSSYKNSALVFIERSLGLMKDKGRFGMIVPKSISFSQLWKPARDLIKANLAKIVDVSKAFEDVLLEQVIIILNKGLETNSYMVQDISSGETISIHKKFIDSTDSIILHADKKDFEIFRKMNESSTYLSSITKTSRGLPFQKYLVKQQTTYPVIKGATISRYDFELSDDYLPEEIVEQNKSKVKFLQQPKVMSQRIVAHVMKPRDHIIIMSALDKDGLMTVDTVESTVLTDKKYSLEFLLCLLNSKLISWYAYRYIFSKAIRTMDLDEYYVGKIPLPKARVDNDLFTNLVDKMLSMKRHLKQFGDKKTDERARIENEINRTDAEIDELVYGIYGITEVEKKIIEGAMS